MDEGKAEIGKNLFGEEVEFLFGRFDTGESFGGFDKRANDKGLLVGLVKM